MGATAQLRSVRSLRNTPNLSLLSERVRRDHETLVEASACPYCLYMAAHTHIHCPDRLPQYKHQVAGSETAYLTHFTTRRLKTFLTRALFFGKHSLLNTLLYNNCCSRNTCSFPSWREIRADGGFGTLNTRIATKLNGWTLKKSSNT